MIKKINLPFILLFTTAFIIMISLFVKKSLDYNNEKEELIEKSLQGVIDYIKKGGRGYYYLKIHNDTSSKNKSYHLEGYYFIKENGIKSGDSVYKEAHSSILLFFKKEKNGYVNCCNYDFH